VIEPEYIPYDNFLPEVMPYFKGVPELVLLNAIRNSAIEFCQKTDWLVYTPYPQQVTAFENEYDLTLDLPNDTVVERVQTAWYLEMPLLPKSEEDLKRIYNLDWRQQTGYPNFYTQYVPETLIMVPGPTITTALALGVTLVVRPSRASTTCDPSLFERWSEEIAAGARARLHATPGQSHESSEMSDKFKAIFDAGISAAIATRNRGLTRTTTRVRPPRD
jgi:hypothetical protein